MSSSFPSPKLSRHEQSFQLSYDLPHRVHTIKVYPKGSPNGSTIILYGHERGVRVVWRGGRSFKPPKPSRAESQANGKSEDAMVISLDSDDEEDKKPAFEDNPEFEDSEEELSPSRPFPSILQFLDLEFGTNAYNIAVPSTAFVNADPETNLSPSILSSKIVFAASCGDSAVRLVTVPLVPPSPTSKERADLRREFGATIAGKGKWGETVVKLEGIHQSGSDGVAFTFVSSLTSGSGKPTTEGRTTRTKSLNTSQTDAWDILLASQSRDVGGTLVIYRIPILTNTKNNKTVETLKADVPEPFQTHYLPSPAITISFNPSLSTRASSQLLLADQHNVVRILECVPSQAPQSSSVDLNGPDSNPSNSSGTWLISLYPGFQKARSDFSPVPSIPRKHIVDAKWILGGKGIMVLLADGEWGIWDLEGTGPGSTKGIVGRQGLRGGANTPFSVSGWVEGLSSKSSNRNSNTGSASSKFAPMTPSTRKSNEPSIFRDRAGSATSQGQIAVCPLPTTSTTRTNDESVALWFEESLSVIPNLAAFWEAQLRKFGGGGNLFNSMPSNSRMLRLASVNLGGERYTSIDQIPLSGSSLGTSQNKGFSTEVIITAEHRLIVAAQATMVGDASTDWSPFATQRSSNSPKSWAPEPRSSTGPVKKLFAPSKLTESSDLDLLGIESALDQMESSQEIIEL